jgi:hypothetical protein
MTKPEIPPSEGRIPGAFRKHFKRHNREALALALVTLVAAALLWTVFYIVIYAVILLGMSSVEGGDARIPPSFAPVFVCCALLLCAVAWVMRRMRPGMFVPDRRPWFETFLDIVLLLPRITFEIWGNFSACQRPTEAELAAAWDLMQAIRDEGGKLNVRQLPVELPDKRLRARVVFLLQLVGLVEVRNYSDGLWLALQDETARRLAQGAVKLDPGLPHAARR